MADFKIKLIKISTLLKKWVPLAPDEVEISIMIKDKSGNSKEILCDSDVVDFLSTLQTLKEKKKVEYAPVGSDIASMKITWVSDKDLKIDFISFPHLSTQVPFYFYKAAIETFIDEFIKKMDEISHKKQENNARNHYLALFNSFFPARNWE